MPDLETRLMLRRADQLRTDIANLECGEEFLMQRVTAVPSARDLLRAITLIALVAAILGVAGIDAFWAELTPIPQTGRNLLTRVAVSIVPFQ